MTMQVLVMTMTGRMALGILMMRVILETGMKREAMSGMTLVVLTPMVAEMMKTRMRMASQGGQVVEALLGLAVEIGVVAEDLVVSEGVAVALTGQAEVDLTPVVITRAVAEQGGR